MVWKIIATEGSCASWETLSEHPDEQTARAAFEETRAKRSFPTALVWDGKEWPADIKDLYRIFDVMLEANPESVRSVRIGQLVETPANTPEVYLRCDFDYTCVAYQGAKKYSCWTLLSDRPRWEHRAGDQLQPEVRSV